MSNIITVHPSFCGRKWLGTLPLLHNLQVHQKQPLSVLSSSRQFPVAIYTHGRGGTRWVNTITWSLVEPRPLDPNSSALTSKPKVSRGNIPRKWSPVPYIFPSTSVTLKGTTEYSQNKIFKIWRVVHSHVFQWLLNVFTLHSLKRITRQGKDKLTKGSKILLLQEKMKLKGKRAINSCPSVRNLMLLCRKTR